MACNSTYMSMGSSNTTVVPTANVAWSGTAPNCTATITPAAGQSGTPTITLTVTDAGGLTASDTFVLTVSTNNAPVANATVSKTTIYSTSNSTTLSGAGSTDADGDTLSYTWSVQSVNAGASGIVAGDITFSSTTVVSPTFTAPDGTGDYSITFLLTVGDGTTTSTATISVIVVDACQGSTAWTAYNEIGSGTSGSPYAICTKAQLLDLAHNGCDAGTSAGCASHYFLAENLNLSGETFTNYIGSSANKFTGDFDGNSRTISNFTVNEDGLTRNAVGLFSYIGSGGKVHDIVFATPSISYTRSAVGVVAGVLDNGTIEDITITGTDGVNELVRLTGQASPAERVQHIGGIVGLSRGGTINRVTVSNLAISSYTELNFWSAGYGAVVGTMTDGTISNATVTNFKPYLKGRLHMVGGVVGAAMDTDITNASFTGTMVTAGGRLVGGIAGVLNKGTITTSTTGGRIGDWDTGNPGGVYYGLGGFAGAAIESTISNSTSTSILSTQALIGKFYDFDDSYSYDTYWRKFWGGAVAGVAYSITSTSNTVTGVTVTWKQSTSGWTPAFIYVANQAVINTEPETADYWEASANRIIISARTRLLTGYMHYSAHHFEGDPIPVYNMTSTLVDKLTTYSNAAGATNPTPDANYPYGPYLTVIPTLDGTTNSGNNGFTDTLGTAGAGWMSAAGQSLFPIINSPNSEKDERGMAYNEW